MEGHSLSPFCHIHSLPGRTTPSSGSAGTLLCAVAWYTGSLVRGSGDHSGSLVGFWIFWS